jgi:RimJ/RimL family protein N-acetyltransferase
MYGARLCGAARRAYDWYMSKIHIETERLVLREWVDADLESFARMNADPVVMEHLPRVLGLPSSKRHMAAFQAHFDKHGYGLYVLERKEDGEFVGFVGLDHVDFKAKFTPAVELAWRLDYEYWGQGYASEAARAVLAHAKDTLKLKSVVAFTVSDNSRTIALMDKLGMAYQEGQDFDYPALKKGHPLGRFVLYRAI